MGINGTASNGDTPGTIALPDAYRVLNEQRVDIDQRIAALAPEDPDRDLLWQDLELVLEKLRRVVSDLAESPATQLSELRDKAGVLATLLRANETGSGPVIPDDERVALALSLTDDVARLSAG